MTAVLDLALRLPHLTETETPSLAVSPNVARLVLLCRPDAAALETVFLLRQCADALILPDEHDDATIRKRVLGDENIENAVRRVRRLLAGRLSPVVVAHVTWCLESLENHIQRRLTVNDMVIRAGYSRTVLDHQFRRAVEGTPRQLIALLCALVAVALWEEHKRSAACLAEELRFSSASSLCQSVIQATGKTLIQIRKAGGSKYLADLLVQRFGDRATQAFDSR